MTINYVKYKLNLNLNVIKKYLDESTILYLTKVIHIIVLMNKMQIMNKIPLAFEFAMDETAFALKLRVDGRALELSDKATLLGPAAST